MTQSGPFTGGHITAALRAREAYREALQDWNRWLENRRSDNAAKLALFKIGEETISRRQQGDWRHLPHDVLPDAAALTRMRDASKVSQFEAEVERLRAPVEAAARSLVLILESLEFLLEYETFNFDMQLEYASELIGDLSSSNVGMRYLRASLEASPTSPLPVVSLERLRAPSGSFVDEKTHLSRAAFDAFRRAASAFAKFQLEILPVILVLDDRAVRDLLSDLGQRYFPPHMREELVAPFPIDPELAEDLEALKARVRRAQEYVTKNRKELLKLGENVAKSLNLILELLSFHVAFEELRRDASVRSTLAFVRGAAATTLAVAAIRQLPIALARRMWATAGLGAVVATYDLQMNMKDAQRDWRTADYSVAAGHAISGVGAASAIVLSAWAATAAAPPVALAFGVAILASIAISWIGQVVVETTRDSDFERWFENHYFGTHWRAPALHRPEDLIFGFSGADGTPDFVRQISAYFSIWYPLGLTVGEGAGGTVLVRLQPALAHYDAQIGVTRLERLARQDDEFTYGAHRVHLGRMDDETDGRTFCAPPSPRPEDQLLQWERTFTAAEMSRGSTKPFDPQRDFVEVDIVLPAGLHPGVASSLAEIPGFLERNPLVLRARARAS